MDYCVYDCDVGSDDAWGLLMLIRAEALKKIKILGVTCVSGNTTVDNVCKNALRILKTAKREDINRLEIANEYKYLGVKLNKSIDFTKHLDEKAKYFQNLINLSSRALLLNLHYVTHRRYGEAYEHDLIEKLHRNFLKKLFNLPLNTPNYVLYLETGLPKLYTNTLKSQADYIVKVPVHKGAFGPLIPPKPGNQFCTFHGTDGFADLEFEPFDHKALVHQKHAVEAMYEYAKKYPKAVTFILVGPLTNFALCLSMYEDFAENVKDVFIMGGNFRGIGNATRSAEFNFYKDPEAAKIVLERTKCRITILPWEPCMEENFEISMDWRINELANQSSCPVVEMLTRIEEAQYIPQGFNSWCPCDALLVAAYLFPKGMIKKQSNWHATVEVHGEQTRGQMVLDHLQSPDNPQNVNLIEHLNCEYFKIVSLWAAGATDSCNGI